jgi:septum formation protein
MPKITLASISPRRHELLRQLGVDFVALDAEVDESLLAGEAPAVYAERLARSKALAGWLLAGRDLPALGADTIVVLDGNILLKPVTRADAADMLAALSGRRHEVISAVALARAEDQVVSVVNRTRVTFSNIPRDWIENYCAGDEPMDKAGAYAVQGEAARWIRHIDGSFSGVMGLPLFETARLLTQAGVLE